MPKSIPSLAEPAMLKWCRSKAGYTTATAAEALGKNEDQVIAWEDGSESPTYAQLCKIAKQYKRPIAVFYLPGPPREFDLIRDFRRIPGGRKRAYSPALTFLIRTCQERQEWLSEYAQFEGDHPLQYVGSASLNDGADTVGKRLRRILNVSLTEQRQTINKDAAFRFWRDACEKIGTCVFVATRSVDVEEMRGFALPDKYAPAVVVNGRDAYAGRTFTLLHEMAHILLGMGGVSDRDVSSAPRSDEQRVEVFCNAVAAEALVPGEDLRQRVLPLLNDLDAALKPMSDFYRVSEEAIARRLLDLGLAGREFYEHKRNEFLNRKHKPDDDKEMRIPMETRTLNNVGTKFSRAAVSAFHEGELSGVELSDLLNMRLQHLSKLEKKLLGRTGS
jgi:Zn-dependent peptidase ImmA (M78 family)/transcriptional regulator with XRE-family HTH domain